MNNNLESRVIKLDEYMINKKAIVRSDAKFFRVSKSTVHTVVIK